VWVPSPENTFLGKESANFSARHWDQGRLGTRWGTFGSGEEEAFKGGAVKASDVNAAGG